MRINIQRITLSVFLALFALASCSKNDEKIVEVAALYDDPLLYAGTAVVVRGSLLWHVDEPVLLPLGLAARQTDFRLPVHLENPHAVDLRLFDRQDVEVTGSFFYRDIPESPDFTGWIRVEQVVAVSNDR